MGNTILEVEHIDSDSNGIQKIMFDGQKITIGKNVQDFYEKLVNLPVSYKCQLLNLDINELSKFIIDSQNHYNRFLILEFKKTWIWRIDSEGYNFSDKDINDELFELSLDKKQILGKLKRNSFKVEEIFRMINFFKNNEDIVEYEE